MTISDTSSRGKLRSESFASATARALTVLAGLAVVVVGQTTTPSATNSKTLRVASWNVLNLFDSYDHPTRPDEGTDPKSRADLKVLAAAIDELDADVLGVQEVENREVLTLLNDHLRRPFAYVELFEGNDFRGIDTGILSRVPIVKAVSHRQFDLGGGHRFARDFPLFRLEPAQGKFVDIGVVHLKSRRGPRRETEAWRRAECEGIRRIVDARVKLEPDVPVIVMGDLNDFHDAKTTEPLFSTFVDCSLVCPEAERYSYIYRGKKQLIDFILVRGDLKTRATRFIHRTDRVSDHHAVVSEFDFGAPIRRIRIPKGEAWAEIKRPRIGVRDLERLDRHLLKEVEVVGKVTKLHRTRSGSWAAFNFHENYRQACTVRIYRSAEGRFPQLEDLVGKTISARGPVCKSGSVYRIVISQAEQLSVEK